MLEQTHKSRATAPPAFPLTRLRDAISKRWPEAICRLSDSNQLAYSTGVAEFNALLPLGGIPHGQLIEITGGVSSGKTSLLFRMIAEATRAGKTVAYVDFGNAFFPDAAATAGADLKKLLVIQAVGNTDARSEDRFSASPVAHPSVGSSGVQSTNVGKVCLQTCHNTATKQSQTCPSEKQWQVWGQTCPTKITPHRSPTACGGIRKNMQNSPVAPTKPYHLPLKNGLRTGEILLRERGADMVVFDLVGQKPQARLPLGLLHRLRLKTVRAKGLVVFLTQNNSEIIPSSMASLRLQTERLSSGRLSISIVKSRIATEGTRVEVML